MQEHFYISLFLYSNMSYTSSYVDTTSHMLESWGFMKIDRKFGTYYVCTLVQSLRFSLTIHYKQIFLDRTAYKQNFSYVMKVDDDTFLNVNLLNVLTEVQKEDKVWWSFFHHHRTVPAYGKWADFTYPSLTYPTFPAGAGYLMTSK